MKGRLVACLVGACIAAGGLSSSVLAATASQRTNWDLSPAIDIIRSKTKLHKQNQPGSAIFFQEDDFSQLFSRGTTHLTVVSLPTNGTLQFLGSPVVQNQTIALRDVHQLCFVPSTPTEQRSHFTFKEAQGAAHQALECQITLADWEEAPPQPQLQTWNTYRDVWILEQLPQLQEGDRVSIEAATQHGLLELFPNGQICYRPQTGFEGRDGFTYTVTDAQGRQWEEGKVIIKVESPYQNVYFSDLKDSADHCAAIDFCKYTGLTPQADENGVYTFDPSQILEKQVFLENLSLLIRRNSTEQEVFEPTDIEEAESYLESHLPDNAPLTRLNGARLISQLVKGQKLKEKTFLEKLMDLL